MKGLVLLPEQEDPVNKFESSLTEYQEASGDACSSKDVSTYFMMPMYGVKTVPKKAFANCSRLKVVILSADLKKIGASAFLHSGLVKVGIPNSVETIDDTAFAFCNKLQFIRFGSGLKQIGAGAFAQTKSLKYVFIPPNVKSIGENAFLHCGAKFIVVPDELKASLQGFGGRVITYTEFFIDIPRIESCSDGVEWLYHLKFSNFAMQKAFLRDLDPPRVQKIVAGLEQIKDGVNWLDDFLRRSSLDELEKMKEQVSQAIGRESSVRTLSPMSDKRTGGFEPVLFTEASYVKRPPSVIDAIKSEINSREQESKQVATKSCRCF